jgi:SAM-dependent methyltransferase
MNDRHLELEPVPCALCGASEVDLVVTGVDQEHDLSGTFDVVRCRSCGHAYLNPRPTPASVPGLYPDDYGSFSASHGGSAATRAKRVYAHVVQFGELPRRSSGRLLEVGCGTGVNLAEHRGRGWDVAGIEPSEAAASRAREAGLDVTVGTDEAVDRLDEASVDELHALMVVEHVPDPIATLRRFRRVVRPGGRVVLSVPNFDARSRKRFGRDWYALQVPRHFHHFDRSSIERALTAAGWEVERVWYQPTLADTTKSIALRWRGRAVAPVARLLVVLGKMADLALLPVLIGVMSRRGSSRMTVTARRR